MDAPITMDQPTNVGILEEFRLEFVGLWRRLPNKTYFLILLAVWLALFEVLGNPAVGFPKTHSLLHWMYWVFQPNSAVDRDDAQGLIAPIVVLGVFWWKRNELLATNLRTWMPAIGVVCLGLLLHLFGFRVQQQRISIIGLFTGIYGLMGLIWGPVWLRKSFFPFCLLAFCVPLGTLSQPITFRLRLLVCQLVEVISQYLLQIDVIRIGTAIRDPGNRFQYEVAPACSGIHSLITTIGLALVYGMIAFRTWWRRGLVFLSAFPLAILGNTLRMLAIVTAAEIGGQEWGNNVHDSWLGSLIPYFLVFTGLILAGRWFGEPSKQSIATNDDKPEDIANWPRGKAGHRVRTKLAFGSALAVILSGGIVLLNFQGHGGLSAPGVKAAPLPGSMNLEVQLPEKVLDWNSEKVPIDQVVFGYLPADTSYGQRKYTAPDGFSVLVNAVLMGSDRASIHKPQICLHAQGWQLDPTPPATKIEMDQPYRYELPVIKLTATHETLSGGQSTRMRGLYVYWYVTDGALSADATGLERMWMTGRDLIHKGTLQRWAYISYFAMCAPGDEDATFERMKTLIKASVPEFQLTAGARAVTNLTSRD
jgi:exosortase